MIVHLTPHTIPSTPRGSPAHPDLTMEATVELSGSASTISADAEYQVAQHKSNGIRDRIKQRSSRILSLLGLRGPSGGRAVDFGETNI